VWTTTTRLQNAIFVTGHKRLHAALFNPIFGFKSCTLAGPEQETRWLDLTENYTLHETGYKYYPATFLYLIISKTACSDIFAWSSCQAVQTKILQFSITWCYLLYCFSNLYMYFILPGFIHYPYFSKLNSSAFQFMKKLFTKLDNMTIYIHMILDKKYQEYIALRKRLATRKK